jgi:prephenate dehydrogenase
VSRAAVVGLGLIGGSVALAAGARGYDRDAGVRERARRRGIETADSLAAAVSGADLVVTAAPIAGTLDLLLEVSELARGAVLTDCASLKRPIVAAAQTLRAAVRFVAGHPMAGGRGQGVEAADPGIFRERPWILVRTERSDDDAVAAVGAFVHSLGARPVVLGAEAHDRVMTWVSHLPQAVSSALARAASRGAGTDLAALAGPGLLDTTRLAGEPAALALELALANPEALAGAIEALSAELGGLATALREKDEKAVADYFARASEIRRSLDRRALDRPPGKPSA